MKTIPLFAFSFLISVAAEAQNFKYRLESCQYMYDVFSQIEGYESAENVQIDIIQNGQNYSYGQQNYSEENQFYVFNQNPSEPKFKTVKTNPKLIFHLHEKAANTDKKVEKSYNVDVKAYRYAYKIKTGRTYDVVILDPAKGMDTVLMYQIVTKGETQWPAGVISASGYAKEADLINGYKTAAAKTPDFEKALEKQLLISCMNFNLCRSMVHSVSPVTERLTFTYKSIKSKDAKYAELATAYIHMELAFTNLKENAKSKTIPCTFQKNVVDDMKIAHDILLKYYNEIDISKADKTDEEKDYEFELSIGLYIASFITGDYTLCETLNQRAETAVANQAPGKLNPLLGITEPLSFSAASRACQEMDIYSYYMRREQSYGDQFRKRYAY